MLPQTHARECDKSHTYLCILLISTLPNQTCFSMPNERWDVALMCAPQSWTIVLFQSEPEPNRQQMETLEHSHVSR